MSRHDEIVEEYIRRLGSRKIRIRVDQDGRKVIRAVDAKALNELIRYMSYNSWTELESGVKDITEILRRRNMFFHPLPRETDPLQHRPPKSAGFPKSLKACEFALRLLSRDQAEIGDLRETFHSVIIPEYGKSWAKFWYLFQAFCITTACIFSKVKKLGLWVGVADFLRRITS